MKKIYFAFLVMLVSMAAMTANAGNKVLKIVRNGEVTQIIPVSDFDYIEIADAEEEPESNTLRVLAIGNSFSEDALEHYLYELAQAEGKELIIGDARIGGCDLQTHLDNFRSDSDAYWYIKIEEGKTRTTGGWRLSDVLADEEWDYISIQQVSDKTGLYSTFEPLGEILDYIQDYAPDAKIIWHSTWAYVEGESRSDYPAYEGKQMIMYEAIQDCTRRVLAEYPQIAFAVPTGTAIQNARGVLGDTLNRDQRHLEQNYGRYTAACTWFETLFGIDVTKNSYTPSTVDDEKGAIARAAAHAAVKNPYTVTPLTDIK